MGCPAPQPLSLITLIWLTLTACSTSPIVLHEDLPAYAPRPGPPETRFGYHRVFQIDDDGHFLPGDYFNLGTRFGQRLGIFTLQEGLLITGSKNSCCLGVQAGVGLASPQVTIYGSWLPLSLESESYTRAVLRFEPERWWQSSLLLGLPYRPSGLGGSAGLRASSEGFGPVCLGEFGSGALSVRGELSLEFPAPWRHTNASGVFASFGLGTAWHPAF